MDKVKQSANSVSRATTLFCWSSEMSELILTCFRISATCCGLWGSVCLVNSGSSLLVLILGHASPFAPGGVSIIVHTAFQNARSFGSFLALLTFSLDLWPLLLLP